MSLDDAKFTKQVVHMIFY